MSHVVDESGRSVGYSICRHDVPPNVSAVRFTGFLTVDAECLPYITVKL